MSFVIPPPAVSVIPVVGGAEFPARRVYCVGRNYAAHAREMGADPTREPPFFFMKPADAILPGGGDFPYPPGTSDLHHEVELVAVLGRGASNVSTEKALDLVYGYAVGLDMTRRDLQNAAKKAGKPWDMGKGFDRSAPCSAIVPAAKIGHPTKGAVTLSVNGSERQRGDLSDLIWSIPEMIAHLSALMELKAGDVVFTGTPEGVGAVVRGDRIHAAVEGVGSLDLTVV